MSETLSALEEIVISLPSETSQEAKAKAGAVKAVDSAKQAILNARIASLGKISYTVGVRRPLLPFFVKYKVVGHSELPDGRLRLTMPDTSVIVIPGIHHKFLKVYADYATASENLQKITQGRGPEQNAESVS